MKLAIKKNICVLTAVATAMSLCACNTEPKESAFDNPLPWYDGTNGSYEKLDYSVAIYDTTGGSTEDKRIRIADGNMSFELVEADGYTDLSMRFSVTYLADAPAPDAGLTDSIASSVTFATDSFAARYMEKEVNIADRAGAENLSYRLTADYYGAHKATYIQTKKEGATEQSLSLPVDTCRDNEMMFFLTRAQSIGVGSSTMFKMVNVFDSFNNGSLAEYTMTTTGASGKNTLDIGDWVSEFGIESVTDENTSEVGYPLSSYEVSISISADKHGPPYVVQYSENSFKKNGKEHKKLPIKISYNQYKGSSSYRTTEYTLTSCSFES